MHVNTKIAIKRLFVSGAILLTFFNFSYGQSGAISGSVKSDEKPIEGASIWLVGTQQGVVSNESGVYTIEGLKAGTYEIIVSGVGYSALEETIKLEEGEEIIRHFTLKEDVLNLEGIVVSGTMKAVSKLESPVPVEVYSSKFFKSNPTPSVFEALQNVNGVRPQLNCSVCNTGDIHINGLEGPYTMVLIDGMPIVSGLSTVYGLFGIPQSLIDRVEVVKGPASTLYGSEAVGGLINIITKRANDAPIISTDIFATSWGEINADIAGKIRVGNKAQSLIGANYFKYSNPVDNNNDGFTDVTLQDRFSVFNKWTFSRKKNRVFSLAARYIYEDRWGGEMNWKKEHRGGDKVYGESIYTNRWELFGTYQLPTYEHLMLHFSTNGHNQNSVYGNTEYMAKQYIGFGQLVWNKQLGINDLLIGTTFRYTYYDDNTPATAAYDTLGNSNLNKPTNTYLPGIFVQDEVKINNQNTLLLGLRYDYNSLHGNIFTPRLNYKWNSKNKNNVLRVSVGNGYRVANVFTEDHAALTGAREVIFKDKLHPETSWNGNVNFVKKIFSKNGSFVNLDFSAFYTYFDNKIIPDYDTDPNQIIYDNLEGHAVSKGLSLNIDIALNNGLKILMGGTYMDVYSNENGQKEWQMFSERFTGVWTIGYMFKQIGLSVDYTGNVYSPMRLPLLGSNDPRREFSPWWSIQNIQLTKKIATNIELYGGVKNLLNWTPNKGNPFIIARSFDPFDKNVQFDTNGQAIITPDNPYGLTFDPAYMYAPNQGIRGFLGFRYTFR